MSDKPIIFSGPMVQALLDGRKTQTRRVLKPQPEWIASSGRWKWPIPKSKRHGCDAVVTASREWHEYLLPHQRPYAPGNRLWVREAWSGNHVFRDTKPSERSSFVGEGQPYLHDEIWYWADGSPEYGDWEKPRPSIHMPRWASRLTLTVTNVRVQRLQDISVDDAIAEGRPQGGEFLSARRWFHQLWNSLHGPEAWDANPWVVCLSFQTHRKNIDEMEVEDVSTD